MRTDYWTKNRSADVKSLQRAGRSTNDGVATLMGRARGGRQRTVEIYDVFFVFDSLMSRNLHFKVEIALKLSVLIKNVRYLCR